MVKYVYKTYEWSVEVLELQNIWSVDVFQIVLPKILFILREIFMIHNNFHFGWRQNRTVINGKHSMFRKATVLVWLVYIVQIQDTGSV